MSKAKAASGQRLTDVDGLDVGQLLLIFFTTCGVDGEGSASPASELALVMLQTCQGQGALPAAKA